MAGMGEIARLIRGLQYVGWNDTQINQLILFIEEGGEVSEKLERLKESLETEK